MHITLFNGIFVFYTMTAESKHLATINRISEKIPLAQYCTSCTAYHTYNNNMEFNLIS